MMTTNHENHEKLSPGVASVRQRPSARPQSRGSSASSDLSLSACPGTKSSTQSAPFNASVETCWNRKPWRFPREKKHWLPGFKLQAIELYDMATKKWIYIYHMGISWEYPGCEDAAGSRPSKNPWGF